MSAYGYWLLLGRKTSFQNDCTLLTTATMRQSWRWFASSPVRHSCETSPGVSPRPTCWLWRQLAQPASACEQRDEEVDDEPGEAESAPSHRDPARPHPAPTDVGDLIRIEPGATPKPHYASPVRTPVTTSADALPAPRAA